MQRTLNLKWVIIAASSVVVAYVVGILLNLPFHWIYTLYGLCVGATIWMTVRILKDPYSTDKTFDDFFYQDRPDIRRVGKE
jgi:hypothetical protein